MFDPDATSPFDGPSEWQPAEEPPEPDRDGRVLRLVAFSLGGVVVLGVVIGLLLSWVGTSVLDAAGIDGGSGGTAQRPIMQDPATPTPSPTATPDEPTTTEPTEPTKSTTTPTDKPPGGTGTLVVTPQSAPAFTRVTLTGRLPGVPAGTSLQVQRLEAGSWVTFPTTATAAASGSFSTYVEIGQPGPNRMRVIVPGSGRSTPTATITIT